MNERIFISSVQKELQAERQAVRDFVRGDPLLRRFFDLFFSSASRSSSPTTSNGPALARWI